jgi:hypothetical protein
MLARDPSQLRPGVSSPARPASSLGLLSRGPISSGLISRRPGPPGTTISPPHTHAAKGPLYSPPPAPLDARVAELADAADENRAVSAFFDKCLFWRLISLNQSLIKRARLAGLEGELRLGAGCEPVEARDDPLSCIAPRIGRRVG